MILESSWDVIPVEAGGLLVTGSSFDGKVASVTAAGGVAGNLYQLTNRVELASGRSDRRSIVLRVERR
jgi:hypothetical protein